MSDAVLTAFRGMSWQYGDKDPIALEALERRVSDTARRGALITYSQLVQGIPFDLPNIAAGRHFIDIGDWTELNRAMVGSFLGYMSMRSYEMGGFFSSALVVSKVDGAPSEGFYSLLKDLGLIASSKSHRAMLMHAEHVGKAHAWYAEH